jgi:hypothetical protein
VNNPQSTFFIDSIHIFSSFSSIVAITTCELDMFQKMQGAKACFINTVKNEYGTSLQRASTRRPSNQTHEQKRNVFTKFQLITSGARTIIGIHNTWSTNCTYRWALDTYWAFIQVVIIFIPCTDWWPCFLYFISTIASRTRIEIQITLLLHVHQHSQEK